MARSQHLEHVDPGQALGPRHHLVWKPVITAVRGLCAGVGQYFLDECDIVIRSDDATFFDPHANGGIVSALDRPRHRPRRAVDRPDRR